MLRVCLQVSKLHHDLEEAIHTNTQLLADSSARQVELKAKEDELAALRVDITKVIKVCLLGQHPTAQSVCDDAFMGVQLGTNLQLGRRGKLLVLPCRA